MKRSSFYVGIVFTTFALSTVAQKHYIGRMQMSSDSVELKFNAIVQDSKKTVILKIINATDTIEMIGVSQPDRYWRFEFPVFNTYLRLQKVFDRWVGVYSDDDKSEVTALVLDPVRKGAVRYPLQESHPGEGRYHITLESGTERERKGLFEFFPFSDSEVRGSVITPTGDYRFLQGSVSGDSLIMSTFDGKFAYVFAGRLYGDSISGHQYFTKSPRRSFLGVRSSTSALPDPKSLLKVSDRESKIRFSLPDVDGRRVTFDASNPGAKLTLITIGGSWCPNCMDEARFLNQIFHRYGDRGLKIIAVYFEYTDQEAVALPSLKRMTTQLRLDFPVLYGGSVRRQMAAEVFPQIEKVLAYPTLIALDSEGNILKTHTGFYGPGTSLYADFEREMIDWIKQVLQ